MRCPQCGTENPPGKIVCRRCGIRLRPGAAAAIGPIPEEELMRRVRSDLRRWLIVTAITVAVGILVGVIVR
ncbi:MAG: zinc ribbon domain-containing protein [Armatimonadota bacterium]|nr:zinc ribbon domain-containing protein [Armatimonadota bacterium]MDR7450259.1 zinc ribbon domain-containing protein [Armatimonadota bacterium]MDR7467158.1 zinc ribbon domain-containing protein [Armatimonadota bacterium]MDR7493300.1 zinc ribbon domain-containing protein [Armatimonadota bacterium]MDR7500149.1 zinc ribbon domain-containing protein [Armatimonadota bacterium]